jgi:hypothetical protein
MAQLPEGPQTSVVPLCSIPPVASSHLEMPVRNKVQEGFGRAGGNRSETSVRSDSIRCFFLQGGKVNAAFTSSF